MSERNDRDYLDFDRTEAGIDSRDYRRRQHNRQSASNARRAYMIRQKRKRARRRKIVITAVTGVILISATIAIAIVASKNQSSPEPVKPVETTTMAEPTTVASTQAQPVSQTASNALDPTVFTPAKPKDSGSDNGYPTEAGLYVWDRKAFELFGGTSYSIQGYYETINALADKLTGFNTYCMIIPNHTEMGLPDRLKETTGTTSQAENIKEAYAHLNNNVTPVNCYNYLSEHCNEYIYFNSDHHWTGLGAYYAYKAFADTIKVEPVSLEDCTEQKIEGFEGTLYNSVGQSIDTDVVSYWQFPYDVSMTVTPEGGGEPVTFDSPYYPGAAPGTLTYGVFIEGDNPLTVMKSSSPNAQKGKKIAVMKESYGNAFVPYLTQNYEEVHVMDLRTFRDNSTTGFVNYCRENGITDVLFLNGVMSANTQAQLDSMTAQFD